MTRGVEPDPQTWWQTYGHRITGVPEVEPSDAEDPPVAPPRPAGRAEPDAGDGAARSGNATAPSRPARTPAPPRPATVGATVPTRPAPPSLPPAPPALRPAPDPPDPTGTDPDGRRAARRDTGRSGATADLADRLRVPLDRPRRVVVTSLKGGVGKTTVTALAGLVLAEHRGDRVVAVDADPDAGTLADRLTGPPARTVRDLLADLAGLDSWTALSRHTGLAGRLHVVAGEQDPAAVEALTGEEYDRVVDVLARYFTVILTDAGPGVAAPLAQAALARADGIVVVGSLTVDAVGHASRTLDRLDTQGRGDLVRSAVVVLAADRRGAGLDTARVRAHFEARCRAVVELPADPHLATGGRIDVGRLRPATRQAALEIAAAVADGFGAR